MKKYLILSCIALATLWSCGNKNGTEPAGEPAAASQEAHAGVLEITSHDLVVNLEYGDAIVSKIEFMRDGQYVGIAEHVAKAVLNPQYFAGTFTFSEGMYHLSGSIKGTLKVDNNAQITYTPPVGATITSGGSFTPSIPPTNSIEKALFVSWKPIKIQVEIEKPRMRTKFENEKARQLGEIAKFINDNQDLFELDEEEYSKYVIKSISLSPAPEKTVAVSFENTQLDPVYGKWTNINFDTLSFSYEIESDLVSDELFQTTAGGSFNFDGFYKTLTVSIRVKSDELDGMVIVTAERINANS